MTISPARLFRPLAVGTALASVVLCFAASLIAQPYHDRSYLVGGYMQATSPWQPNLYGLHRLDVSPAGVSLQRIFLPGGNCRGFRMEINNREIVVSVEGSINHAPPWSGLYRLNPATGQYTTIYSDQTPMGTGTAIRHFVVDCNGHYIASVFDKSIGDCIWRIDQSGQVATIASTLKLGRVALWRSALQVDILSGKVLICDERGPFPVLQLDPDNGTLKDWNRSSSGWDPRHCAPQSHRNGCLEGLRVVGPAPADFYLYQVAKGTSPGKRVGQVKIPSNMYTDDAGAFDLQTASNPRLVYMSRQYSPNAAAFLYHVDRGTFAVTSVVCSTVFRGFNLDFAFYRGRHTQTSRMAPRCWHILLSAPARFAGLPYVLAASLSGIRPGLALRDGRRINMNPDALTALTIRNQLPGIWNGGSGVLNARAEAQGSLDLSAVGRLGQPLWLVWAVLDPKAPLGIAFLPDTYVMRL